ncbi:MAG: DUF1552 domain-containing protein [Myxococcales bacterium]|nr:DUF1552 domain-containing protein [Myxococcales bacterium]
MRYDPFTRRLFLTGLGGAVLALPLLPSLLPRALRAKAEAQAGAPPRRFVALKTYNGMPVNDFYPRNPPAGYSRHSVDGTVALREPLRVATGRHASGRTYFGHAAPLTDFADAPLSNVFGTAFGRFYDQMTLFRGLDFMPNLNHNHGGFLGNLGLRTNGVGGALPGAQINATIDHVMARSPAVYPSIPSGPRVLHVGSRRNTCSYAPTNPDDPLAVGLGAVQQAQAYTNPRTAFDVLFEGFAPPAPGMTPAPERPRPTSRLVDRVMEDYRRAARGPNLSAADRRTLERHLAHLAELEARLEGPGMGPGATPGACEPRAPGAIDTGGEFDVSVPAITGFWEAMVDVVALALACDVTRVATIDVAKMVIPEAGGTFGMGDSENPNAAGRSNWHLQAHEWDANAQRWIGLGNQWVAQTVVHRLLTRLGEVSERDGQSLLHHSLVLWGNELSFNHLNYSMPTVLFGRAGGRVRAGRYIDYIDHDQPIRFRQHDGSVIEGVQYNRLLVTLMQAMGLAPSEYERVAGRGFGETRAIEKGSGFAVDYDDSNVGEPLPDLMA